MPWKILVVDPQHEVRPLLELALGGCARNGRTFAVTAASSSEEAKALISTEFFDIALIDIAGDSEPSGIDVCEHIRATSATAPRIVLVGADSGSPPDEALLDRLDVDFYLRRADITGDSCARVARSCLRSLEDYLALEQANEALARANDELTRQRAVREGLVAQLGDTEAGFLAQLIDALDRASVPAGQDDASQADALREVANRMGAVLQLDDSRVKVEETLRLKRVLLLLDDKKTLRITRGALAGTVESIAATIDRDEALEILRAGQTDLLYVGWEDRAVLREAARYNPKIHTVILTSERQFLEASPEMFEMAAANAVIISPLVERGSKSTALSVHELVVTAGKLISGDTFGLEKYLAWGVNVHEETLDRTVQRNGAINRVLEFARRCNVRIGLVEKIGLLADELLMNAMWDAPIDAQGRSKYNHLPRAQPLVLEPDEAVLLRYASDGNHFAVSVTDNFGNLQRDVAFRYVRKCMSRRGPTHGHGEGGAGLGLYLAYLSMSHFVVNVLPGKRTEVIGFLDTHVSPREVDIRPRRFHYFTA